MTDTVSKNGVLAFAKAGINEVERMHAAAVEARELVQKAESDLEKELRGMLRGKTIILTGPIETAEVLFQDGYGHTPYSRELRNERMVVGGIYVTDGPHSRKKTPLIYATHEEAYKKGQRGGEVSFRLLRATKLEIVD